MHLIIQGADIETTALKLLAKATGASAIEQIRPDVFRLRDARPVEGVAELCTGQGLDWEFVPDTAPLPP